MLLASWAGTALAQVEGKLALRIWASEERIPGARMELAGCEAHLVPQSDPDAELVYPCGELFAPPLGKYLYWVEGEGRISPEHLVLTYSGEPYAGRVMEPTRGTVPAGRVSFAALPAMADASLRLLHLDSHEFGGQLGFEFHRRFRLDQGGREVRLPEGRAVAWLYDNAKKEYLALGRPFAITAAGPVSPPAPQPPRATAVLAVIERPVSVATRAEDDLAPSLVVDRQPGRAPDLRFADAARVYAVWYEVEGQSARLDLASARWRIGSETVALRRGKVEVFRPRLERMPKLEVGLARPEAWQGASPEIYVLPPGRSRRDALRTAAFPAGADALSLPALPARPLEVELKVGPFTERQFVDMSDGSDREIFFRPEPIEIHGQVFAGDQPARGTVIFALNPNQGIPDAGEDRLEVETDSEGRYRATFFRPAFVPASVALAGRQGMPFLVSARLYLGETGQIDLHVPANRFTVELKDAATGRGVPAALVRLVSHFGDDGQSVLSARDHTGPDGRLELPPIRPGSLELTARADGYEEAKQEIVVSDTEPGRSLRFELRRREKGESLSLVLPDGRPAAGAAAALFRGTVDGSSPIWQSRADAEGKIELPTEARGAILLVRHPAAGAAATSADEALRRGSLKLPARAPDLLLTVLDRGGQPAPATGLALRCGDVFVASLALAWLLETPLTSSDGSGHFRAVGLPREEIALVAWESRLQGEANAGQLAAFATTLDLRSASGPFELVRVE